MECKEKKKGHDVIPVFYDINPSHVRKQIGSYKTTFDKHEQDFKHKNKEMLQKWKDALTKAANISGFDSDSHVYRTESDMIKGIIKLILRKLNRKHSYELRDHFIPNENYAAVKSLLSNEASQRTSDKRGDSAVHNLCGMHTMHVSVPVHFYLLVQVTRWIVCYFNDQHNHQLLPGFGRIHRSQSKITEPDMEEVRSLRRVGIKMPYIYASFAERVGGYPYVGFKKKALYNRLHCENKDGVGHAALKYMRKSVSMDPGFVWKHARWSVLRDSCGLEDNDWVKAAYVKKRMWATAYMRVTMPSVQYEYLNLCVTSLNELPSSILHLRNIRFLAIPLCQSLRNLPENFADHVQISPSLVDDELDASNTLRTLLLSPGFKNVKFLIITYFKIVGLDGIARPRLSELPAEISSLSSLVILKLEGTDIVSLPESIKHLPLLEHLDVRNCSKLQYIPALPQSIEYLNATDCTSLKTVLFTSKTEPPKLTFLFYNCWELDQDAILEDAFYRIDHGAKSLSVETLEQACSDDDFDGDYDVVVRSGKICHILPATRGVGEYFHYCSTQASITITLQPNIKFLGFVFYFVLSPCKPFLWPWVEKSDVTIGCECSLGENERVDVTSFFSKREIVPRNIHAFKLKSDHMVLWYDAQCNKKIMEAINERKAVYVGSTAYNPILTFKFYAQSVENEELVIKECGIRCIYPSEDQNVEEGIRSKSKRSRETYEQEASAVPNGAEHYEFDEPEDMVPPTKKFKQCEFGTPSNLNSEVEDLSCHVTQRCFVQNGSATLFLSLVWRSVSIMAFSFTLCHTSFSPLTHFQQTLRTKHAPLNHFPLIRAVQAGEAGSQNNEGSSSNAQSSTTAAPKPLKKPVYSMKKGQIVRVDKEKYLNSVNYLSVGHPPYYKGLDYIYEDRGEVLDLRIFETGEYALIAWVGVPTAPAWLPTEMLIKSEKLDYERL
ncbi:hypothetical protein RIF29_11010 [Crotalaria pallida]|uniref:TIR domain-containing protein n=1 Tax=Crotalaria pallida TaxID=3830 RepID=A0AAN9FZF6_CROPI